MSVALGMPALRRGSSPLASTATPASEQQSGVDEQPSGVQQGSGDQPGTTADRPTVAGLLDRQGRVATDLRVSLTDRCNLRCGYCMPAEGLTWTPTEHVLTDAEVLRLIRIAVERLGVGKVRFTGGEPLLRAGLIDIVAATAQLRGPTGGPPDTGLTTNGLGLARKARALATAGLGRVNVSLDTLHRERFLSITRRDRLDDVLAGLAAAQSAGLGPVKVNAVLLRGINDDEAPALLGWALGRGYELRFIEQMPLAAQGGWSRSAMVTADEILASLRTRYEIAERPDGERGAAPAERFDVRLQGRTVGQVGVIASVSKPFCGACDRTRLTADGQLRNCLFTSAETDLRALLRGGADDAELAQAWRGNAWAKLPGHRIDDAGFVQPVRPMSAIGG